MSKNVFISYDHGDVSQVNGFKLLNNNPDHVLDFRDHSLKDPVLDKSGKPIIYPPNDDRSKPVREEIISKFDNASKLVVLIGPSTFDSEWVDWEIKTFYNMKYDLSGDKTWQRIRGMRLKDRDNAKKPSALGERSTEVMNWNPEKLDKWIDKDPD
ncbi:MAG: TIR domain-containing protein [Candidatus Firestonebacteria bacterium]